MREVCRAVVAAGVSFQPRGNRLGGSERFGPVENIKCLKSARASLKDKTWCERQPLRPSNRLGIVEVRDKAQDGDNVAFEALSVGRQFMCALLHAVCSLSEDELQTALGRLVASELVFRRGTPPDAIYSFKHALVQARRMAMPGSNCMRGSPER
jgi:hypothetical protein